MESGIKQIFQAVVYAMLGFIIGMIVFNFFEPIIFKKSNEGKLICDETYLKEGKDGSKIITTYNDEVDDELSFSRKWYRIDGGPCDDRRVWRKKSSERIDSLINTL